MPLYNEAALLQPAPHPLRSLSLLYPYRRRRLGRPAPLLLRRCPDILLWLLLPDLLREARQQQKSHHRPREMGRIKIL